jgi:penicillin amidase
VAHWRHPLSDLDLAAHSAARHDIGPAPVEGGADTVRNTGSSARFEAASGAEYRLVVDFATPDRFWAVQNAGNSGVPGSPHYADQFPAWLAGDYHVVHLRRAAVEAEAESLLTIMPHTDADADRQYLNSRST